MPLSIDATDAQGPNDILVALDTAITTTMRYAPHHVGWIEEQQRHLPRKGLLDDPCKTREHKPMRTFADANSSRVYYHREVTYILYSPRQTCNT